MKHLVVHHSIALKLKELNFNEPCIGSHIDSEHYLNWDTTYGKESKSIKAPTYDQVLNWFESNHGLHLIPYLDDKLKWKWKIHPNESNNIIQKTIESSKHCYSRRDAQIKAIQKAISIVEKNISLIVF